MKCLLSLLNERDQGDRLMKAELLRELGDFEEAETLLLQIHAESLPTELTFWEIYGVWLAKG